MYAASETSPAAHPKEIGMKVPATIHAALTLFYKVLVHSSRVRGNVNLHKALSRKGDTRQSTIPRRRFSAKAWEYGRDW
jgi:hypothetical protein